MGKATLNVEILPWLNKGFYKVAASSRDGLVPYEGFASAIGVTLHLESIKGKDPA